MNAYLLGQQTPDVWNFGLFSIEKVGYQAQVIPALLAGLALGFIETRLKRIVRIISTWSSSRCVR
ncbi:trehalose-specific PTS system IIBC protein [Salmonella enterica subsp. enterica]|uniref:Trehalose-specific PTS system IIBC protein n=1 Tax=Salmonella enterica I TaxID=59201 RepID=A0A379X156_SALET|nr:trehalose-specific PTS system IIBC protein [Salmonella enterica subsp. enterica]